MGTRYNYDNAIVCKNPNCRSYGRAHPNCACGGGGLKASAGRAWEKAKGFASRVVENYGASGAAEGYAEGGEVHHCESCQPHLDACEHFASGGQVADQHKFAEDPSLSVDHAILGQGLAHTLAKAGRTRSKDHTRDFMEAAKRGRGALDTHAKALLNHKADPVPHDKNGTELLESHIEALRMNPSLAEELGGGIGDGLPDHQMQLVGKLASVMSYFDALKPHASQGGPLDKVVPPSKREMARYKRKLAIAENPALIYEKAKNATLHPGDIEIVKTIYPKLYQEMCERAADEIVNAKTEGRELSRREKHGLGILMGQDLGFIHTPEAMQAIMKANAASPIPQRKQLGGNQNKPNDTGVRESNKQAQLEATQSQERELRNQV
jgi:hypothetical protein